MDESEARSQAARTLRQAGGDKVRAALAAGLPHVTRPEASAAGAELAPAAGYEGRAIGGHRRMQALGKAGRAALAREGGIEGSRMLSAAQRVKRARMAAKARWAKWRRDKRDAAPRTVGRA